MPRTQNYGQARNDWEDGLNDAQTTLFLSPRPRRRILLGGRIGHLATDRDEQYDWHEQMGIWTLGRFGVAG
jgi:hypothetical protein